MSSLIDIGMYCICCHFDLLVKLLGKEVSAMVRSRILHGQQPKSLLISAAKFGLGIRTLISYTIPLLIIGTLQLIRVLFLEISALMARPETRIYASSLSRSDHGISYFLGTVASTIGHEQTERPDTMT